MIHLADGEIIGASRFRQVYCDHPDPLTYYVEGQWAEKLDYQRRSPLSVMDNLELFSLLRKTTYTILEICTEEDWAKSGIHPNVGK